MPVITIRLNEEDKAFLQNFAKLQNVSISELIRNALMEKIENEIDSELYNRAVAALKNDEPILSFDEMMKEIGLENVSSRFNSLHPNC
jgi:uncharacterized protein (DUF1778 family)